MACATRPVTSTKARSPSLRLVRSRRVASCVASSKIEARALGGDLAEARIGHFRELALVARAHPGAARRLLVEQAHLAEELTLVEVGEHHLVAFLVLDHHFDRAADDVVEDVGQIARVDHDRLGRHRANAAIAQKSVDRRNIAQRLDVLFHTGSPIALVSSGVPLFIHNACRTASDNAIRARAESSSNPVRSAGHDARRVPHERAHRRRQLGAAGRRCALPPCAISSCPHRFDDRAAAQIAGGQPRRDAHPDGPDLPLGLGDEAEAGAIAKQSRRARRWRTSRRTRAD